MSETIGQRVERLRTQHGWQKKQLAERAGLDPSHIGTIEAHTRTRLQPETLKKLARALDVSASYLLDGHQEADPSLEEYRTAIQTARDSGITPAQLQSLLDMVIGLGNN